MTSPTKVVGRRVVARLIDVVLGLLIFAVLYYAFSRHLPSGSTSGGGIVIGHTRYGFTSGDGGRTLAAYGITLLIDLLLFVIMPGITGKTPGKTLLGIRIVKGDGTRPGVGRSFLRELLMIIDSIPGFYLVGFIVALVSRNNRRVGDMAAGTYVVRDGVALTGLGLATPGAPPPVAAPPPGPPPPPAP